MRGSNRAKWAIFLIIAVTLFLRFYNYQNRWTLNQDQARDAIIAFYSIHSYQVPLVGPPSSAGNFSFGPLYYWIIIIFSYVLPLINGPWVGFTLLSAASAIIVFLLGKKIGGLIFGSILGMLWAVASGNVFNATDMLNPMLIGIAVAGVFYSLHQILENNSKIYSTVFGFCIGAAINFHFQSLGLLSLILLVLLSCKQKAKNALFIILGLLISFAPIIYFDFYHNYVWSKGVLNYFISGQDKFNIHYSLINDVLEFWPNLWGEAITGVPIVGYLFVLLFLLAIGLIFKYKLNQHKTYWVILASFLLQIIILNFYKGPRLTVYLLVYHPFLIFLSGWSIWIIWRINKYLAYSILIIILAISLYSDFQIVSSNTQTSTIYKLKQRIDQIRPGSKHVYSYQNSHTTSLPLYYLWLKEGNISNNGAKIGICEYSIQRDLETFDYIENCKDTGGMILSEDKYRIFDLSDKKEEQLKDLEELSSIKIYNWLYDRYK